ncbi:hypothetical protein Egran_05417 [Elaphomyces granulatus]|uniref:RTA1 domain protein n=1 Tax=Elaphomyces granulatus TaxID=519963 RepID=A0A232LRQ3_9EURO|nr:hypothetical protein Egran_05417 [Elaphomyces granulatus]
MQISTLIIAPTFFTAGIYILLGRFIALLGRGSSVLSPALYLWIFCTCDLISLVIQAIGGGLASNASNQADGDTKPGANIIVAGIIIQLVSTTVFAFLALDFLRRTIRQGTLRTMKRTMVPLLCAMVLSVICIYIRSIYRTIELLQGWNGYLITTEIFFVILDGAMMVPAVAIFNIIHPGWFMPTEKELDFLTSTRTIVFKTIIDANAIVRKSRILVFAPNLPQVRRYREVTRYLLLLEDGLAPEDSGSGDHPAEFKKRRSRAA